MSALRGVENVGIGLAGGLGIGLAGVASATGEFAKSALIEAAAGINYYTFRPGKAIDDVAQMKQSNAAGVQCLELGGEGIWAGLQRASHGLGQIGSAGAAFLGESVQGAARHP